MHPQLANPQAKQRDQIVGRREGVADRVAVGANRRLQATLYRGHHHTAAGRRYWQPMSGTLAREAAGAQPPDSPSIDRKRAKGRARAQV